MGRRLRWALLSVCLLAVVVGSAFQVGDGGGPNDSVAMPRDPSSVAISSIPDAVIGATSPAARALWSSRYAGPDRSAALLTISSLALLVAGAAWTRRLATLPLARWSRLAVAVPAAPRAPPRSA